MLIITNLTQNTYANVYEHIFREHSCILLRFFIASSITSGISQVRLAEQNNRLFYTILN